MLARQSLLAIVTGLLFCTLIAVLARRKLLSFRYALGWLFVGLSLVVAGIGLDVVTSISEKLSVTPTTLVLGGIVVSMLMICVQLSISLSGSAQQIRDLNEAIALLDARLQQVEEPS